MEWVEQVTKKFLKVRNRQLKEYLHYWLHGSFPLDEAGILILCRAYKVHTAVFFNDSYWTTEVDDDLHKCKVFLLYRGSLVFEDSRRMTTSEHRERTNVFKKLEKYYADQRAKQEREEERENRDKEAVEHQNSVNEAAHEHSEKEDGEGDSESSASEGEEAKENGNIMPLPQSEDEGKGTSGENKDQNKEESYDASTDDEGEGTSGENSSSDSDEDYSSAGSSSSQSETNSEASDSVAAGSSSDENKEQNKEESYDASTDDANEAVDNKDIMPTQEAVKTEKKVENIEDGFDSSDEEPLSRKRKRVTYDESSDSGMGDVVTEKKKKTVKIGIVRKPLGFKKRKRGRIYCDVKRCKKNYGTMRAMQRHKKNNHNGDKKFFCDEDLKNGKKCGHSYPNEQQLEQHIRGKHGDGFIAYCGKRFIWPKQRQDHQGYCSRCDKVLKA